MKGGNRKGLVLVTVVFWVLFLYIIAALVWWFVSLERQNKTIHTLRKSEIGIIKNDTGSYQRQWQIIDDLQQRNSKKYIGEGVTFLLLILFGAAYVYRLVRRQFRLQQQQQNFMMAITHELKTPISVARLNLETLQKRQLPEERRQKLLQTTVEETTRLDNLINNILISSQLDGNAYKASKEELNFSALVEDVVQQFGSRYPERIINSDIETDVDLKGDPLLLKLLVSNLLENANKYSGKETPITCRLLHRDRTVILQISDEGIGISADEKGKVCNKFYRVGNEQTRTTKGTGLGLFICRKIAQHHYASISISDNEPAGTTFTISFKASE
ncbi:MAG: histidine kinase [Flaviaesturariibacter sp.]|nr:histidine kinase [Flaviaesturariibacter sp.]